MKKTTNLNHESKSEAKGRKVSAAIHLVFLGLLAFPFLQMVAPEATEDVQIVMDFSSGSSAEGAKAAKKNATSPKSVEVPKPEKAKPVLTAPKPEKVVLKEDEETPSTQSETTESKPAEDSLDKSPEMTDAAEARGMGAGDKGKGDAAEGSANSGNGRGYIEGSGALTRAVIDRGNTKQLAQQNGTLILKICINRRGIVTHAEWDKEASSIKDSGVARTALDNVLKYRFETNRSAPRKECGRLTYIIDVD